MTQAEKFKEKIKMDKDFKEKFKDVKNKEEMISIAKKEGYDLTTLNDKEEEGLTEDMLESVAGGAKGDTHTYTQREEFDNNLIVPKDEYGRILGTVPTE